MTVARRPPLLPALRGCRHRTRRRGPAVAEWVAEVAGREQPAAGFEIIDLADFGLPLLDEPHPPASGLYGNAHTIRWAEAIAGYDGFVFVTPEYNHSVPGALKNALDFVYAEWHDKAAASSRRAAHLYRGAVDERVTSPERALFAEAGHPCTRDDRWPARSS
ncbi:NADPH-dependent FMN reductase [Nonomuraea sp. NPDC001831]|uniref:NADPH-dependent FMN reductase n=1 Tax=Nonomuraea sp. NPDC001831 TaxID=3364340 RepID=UPI0036BC5057